MQIYAYGQQNWLLIFTLSNNCDKIYHGHSMLLGILFTYKVLNVIKRGLFRKGIKMLII